MDDTLEPAQVGGYLWRLDGMDFVTVQSAGHMVPEDQPKRAYDIIFDWIDNTGIWAPPSSS
jgi:carboxypeptidase C (cathepsin A)